MLYHYPINTNLSHLLRRGKRSSLYGSLGTTRRLACSRKSSRSSSKTVLMVWSIWTKRQPTCRFRRGGYTTSLTYWKVSDFYRRNRRITFSGRVVQTTHSFWIWSGVWRLWMIGKTSYRNIYKWPNASWEN